MITVIDASVLVYMLDAQAPAPIDRQTGQPLADCKARVDYLVETLAKRQDKLVIPTPALTEVLAKAGAAGPEWLRLMRQSRHIRLGDFDERAAVECAILAGQRFANGGGPSPRAKAKFDEQIVAIANVAGAKIIYSDDADIARLAREGVEVLGVRSLPLPPEAAQADFLDQLADAEGRGTPAI